MARKATVVVPIVFAVCENDDVEELDEMLDVLIGQKHAISMTRGRDRILYYHFDTDAEADRAEQVIKILQEGKCLSLYMIESK